MKCPKCNKELPDDALFCSDCGTKIEQKKEEEKEEVVFCSQCGEKLKPKAQFCGACGAKIIKPEDLTGVEPTMSLPETGNEPTIPLKNQNMGGNPNMQMGNPGMAGNLNMQMNNGMYPGGPMNPQMMGQQMDPRMQQAMGNKKKKSKTNIIIIVIMLALIVFILLGIIGFLVVNALGGIGKNKNEGHRRDYEVEEVDKSDVDYDLTYDENVTLSGNVKVAQSGERVLQWNDGYTFYGEDEDGKGVKLVDAKSAYIKEDNLPAGFVASLDSAETFNMIGTAYFEGDKLFIKPTSVTNSQGADAVAAFNGGLAASTDDVTTRTDSSDRISADYIIPESSNQKLTDADISSLTLQELNYAKNEIYARHGRMFDSPELQRHFGSKSWYSGTISPSNFSDSMLSGIERDNVKLIKNKEYSINPNGYPLDK